MSAAGHNNGPTMEAGAAWRKLCWSKARAQLLPTLPIEIVRRRVKRAAELGLDYKSYASIRAKSGHDVVAFLFSSNALRLLAASNALPPERVQKLSELKRCCRLVAVQKPLGTADVIRAVSQEHGIPLDAVFSAPDITHTWGQTRRIILEALRCGKIPADCVVAVGDTALEHAWCDTAGLAGYLSSKTYFGDTTKEL